MSNLYDLRNKAKPKMTESGLKKNAQDITMIRPNRKYEGYDQLQGENNVLKKSKNFNKNLNDIQTRTADENIEEEYTKGLQDELKFLEYELKLLKDKEMEMQSNSGQLDKFFSDGVPLNENILAMKNHYSSVNQTTQKKLQLSQEIERNMKNEALDLNEDIDKLEEYYQMTVDQIKEKGQKYLISLEKLRKHYSMERHFVGELESELKNLTNLHRTLQEEILKLNRTIDRENILFTHREDEKKAPLAKLKQAVVEKEKKILKISNELEEIRGSEKIHPAVQKLEQENADLSRKLMTAEKDINVAKNKCAEMKFILETRSKEREQENDQKRKLFENLSEIEKKIKEETQLNELVLNQKVEEKEKADIREYKKKIDNAKKLIKLYNIRSERIDNDIRNKIDLKILTQQETLDNERQINQYKKEINEAEQALLDAKNAMEVGIIRDEELTKEIAPLRGEIIKLQEQIGKYQSEIEKLKSNIDYYVKQLDLSAQIKNLNLEEIKMISNSNKQVNSAINVFIKNWESIQNAPKITGSEVVGNIIERPVDKRTEFGFDPRSLLNNEK